MKLESIFKNKMRKEIKKIIFKGIIKALKKFVFWHILSVIYSLKIRKKYR